MDFDYISVKTQLFARAKQAPAMPRKAARPARGRALCIGEDTSPSTPPHRGTVEGKASLYAAAQATPPAAMRTVLSGHLFCGRRTTAENSAGLWKLPAVITGEREAIYKHATKLSSQCPILQRKKKSVTAGFSARCPLDPLLETEGLRVADLLVLHHY